MIYNFPEVIAARALLAEFPARFALRSDPDSRFRLTANSTTLFLERVTTNGGKEQYERIGPIARAELRALIIRSE